MARTDWDLEKSVLPEDMNAIGEEINKLREDVDNIEIPPASLSEAGIVQLSNKTDGTSEAVAATEKAVKSAYDRGSSGITAASAAQSRADSAYTEATAAKQLGNERKADVVAALVAIGVSASTSETWTQLINKISAIIRATGSANVGQVLAGVPFSNGTGNNRTGTMPNRGAISQTITTQGGAVTIPDGYHNGAGVISASFANLIAAYIKDGVNIGGVVGNAKVGEAPYKMPQVMISAGATFDVALPYDFNFLFIQSVTATSDWVYITRVNIANKVDLHGYTNSGSPISTSFPTPTTLRFNNSGNGNRWYDVTIIKRLY